MNSDRDGVMHFQGDNVVTSSKQRSTRLLAHNPYSISEFSDSQRFKRGEITLKEKK
ncbi:hypothetical protein RMSM_02019 [Rhodopirellula maiorica SM1]|uniref:Uncharacterized protein n=1 Tax=Rhodopirellula maiorica SM1 TaxID=1265738 RepID=M5S066_9BACT|nr:hypothetical protein RMSM_02019 [Rhodopirellula maiorica SM1]